MIMHYALNPADALEITDSKLKDIVWAGISHSQTTPAKGKSSHLLWGKRRERGKKGAQVWILNKKKKNVLMLS